MTTGQLSSARGVVQEVAGREHQPNSHKSSVAFALKC